MKKFVIYSDSVEIKYKDYKKVVKGCAAFQDWGNPLKEKEFDDLESAKEELQKYTTNIVDYGRYFLVTEYFIEELEIEYDQDGEIEKDEIQEVYEVSNMVIKLVERNTYEVLGVFDTLESAKEAENRSEKECYIEF